jgi:multisubunit Na+/H+ antiporter MnhB subunit
VDSKGDVDTVDKAGKASSGTNGAAEEVTSIMTQVVARLLLAPTLVAAVAIIVKGYAQPGDGFSAGVVAALGLLMQYLAFGRDEVERTLPVRGIGKLSYIGLLIALAVAIVPLFMGDPVFTHYPAPGSHVIYIGTIELITAVAFDCGIALLVLGYGTGVISLVSRVMGDPTVADVEEKTYEVGPVQRLEEGRTL